MWKIGNIEIKNQIVLAPMAGTSNPSYMKICEEMGVGYAVTELISAEAIVRNNKKTFDMLKGIEKLNIPVAVQIFGSNPDTMAKAAKIITSLYKNVFIDINMGCPVPKIAVSSKAGSALLKDVPLIKEIVRSVVQAINVPVTVKIRSGWDQLHLNAVLVAKSCEESGASAIAIHARTRSQGYKGNADWKIIQQVKEAVSIPVIGNGDVTSPLLAKKMLEETGCDAVMIGRGVLGNPWLIKNCVSILEEQKLLPLPTPSEKIAMCSKHLLYLSENKTERQVVLEIRSHIAWYLKGLKDASAIKTKIFQLTTINDIMQVLKEYNKYLKELENESKF